MKDRNLSFIMNNKNSNNTVFLQLDEKKDRQPHRITKRVKGTIALFLVTIMILSLIYASDYLKTHENNVYATDSYSIMSGENELCRVRDPELLDKVLKKIDKELERKFNHEIKIESKFDLVASKAKDKEIASEDQLYQLVKSNIVYSIMAYQINVNGEKIGIVNSQYEAQSVIEEVKNYFTKNYDKETLLEVTTVEDIEIKQVKATNAEIQDKDKLIEYIIKGTNEEKKYIVEKGDSFWSIAEHFNMDLEELLLANSASGDEILQIGDEVNLIVPKPFINVQVKRKVTLEEKMPYETEYTYVSYMYNDEEIVTKKGKYGISEVEAIVTEQNGIVVAKEILSEKVITEPVKQVVTVGTQDPPPKQGTGYFINPLPGSMITSRFGSRAGGFHLGQDMAKPTGSSIKAADGGTVIFAGWSGTYGYMVDIDHGGGFTTRYAHCSEIYVSVGEKVYQGKIIAAVGSTGLASGPHLHFEVRKYGSVVNPASYIGTQYR
ncbi:MAG: peptidoglycan DD-metalloendopeptidase family protein [Sedimentibacter sp.]|jgi:murein DD-endopeptidase MepM/ murein hydrolase activator NlpD|nr:peptidoglycan DD-metalloendopeptidase family protein [Sedimentibacter sp.]